MSSIDKLSSTSATELNGSDLLPVWVQQNGDTRKLSLTNFLTWLKTNFTRQDYTTTILVPTNGFSQTITQDGLNRHLLLNPAGTLATGTVVLPAPSVAVDGQEIMVTSSQTITALTVDDNGATATVGAPTTIGATSPFRLRYNSTLDTWFLVA